MPSSTIPFGAILELVIAVGLGLGLVLLGIALLISLGDGRWLPVEAEIVENRVGPALRWNVDDIAYRKPISAEERDALRAREDEEHAEGEPDADLEAGRNRDRHQVFYSAGHPQRIRWHHPLPGLAALRLCAYAFLGIAAAAIALSFVEMALQG